MGTPGWPLERRNEQKDKDALDVLHLLQSGPSDVMAGGVRTLLGEEISSEVTEEALYFLQDQFFEPSRPGSQMAARAAAPLESEESIAASCAFLAQDLLREIGSRWHNIPGQADTRAQYFWPWPEDATLRYGRTAKNRGSSVAAVGQQ